MIPSAKKLESNAKYFLVLNAKFSRVGRQYIQAMRRAYVLRRLCYGFSRELMNRA